MPLYFSQFSYTNEAWTQLVRNPQDREANLKAMAEKIDSKIISFYYMQGEYDGIIIWEAPDDQKANALIFAATAAGHVKVTKSTRLYTMDELIGALKKAQDIEYTAPSGIKKDLLS